MRTINPKCSNEDSFEYSRSISFYYYELNTHKERINQLEKYLSNHNFETDNYDTFEDINLFISLRVYDENGEILHKSLNLTNNEACIVKINNHRFHALKPNKNKYNQLKELINQFTHEELTDFILNKVSY